MSINQPTNLNLLWSQLIVQEFVKSGIDTFFISPGNRNLPLIAALVYSKNAIKKTVIDERAAGYQALGYAKATGKPGVLVCTSGTALSNYYPAVIEASKDEHPLIVLSADRPPELSVSDANQSINQTGIFGAFIRHGYYLPCPSETYPISALLTGIDYAAHFRSGPVHINCPFREPLIPQENDMSDISESYLQEAKTLLNRNAPFTLYSSVSAVPKDLSDIRNIIQDTKKGLIIVGRLHTEADENAVIQFSEAFKWPVFCDVASSLKGQIPFSDQIFTFDHPEAIRITKEYAPETILQFGTRLVSKTYYKSILTNDIQHLILVSPKKGFRDPAHRVSTNICATAEAFVNTLGLNKNCLQDLSAKREYIEKSNRLKQELDTVTSNDRLSSPIIADTIYRLIPENETLFLGNSTVIRSFDMSMPDPDKRIRILSNRGVSGIEGHMATCIGYAEGTGCRITSVIGDISFLHDLNSLQRISQSIIPIIVIVVNNQGGRIFERLPANRFPEITTPYMTTPHQMDFKYAAEQFSLSYDHVSTPTELEQAYEQALESTHRHLIEIQLSHEKDLETFNQRMLVTLNQDNG